MYKIFSTLLIIVLSTARIFASGTPASGDSITVTIIDESSGNPITNIKGRYYFTSSKVKDDLTGTEFTTDNNGKFKFNIAKDDHENVKIKIKIDGDKYEEKEQDLKNETNIISFYLSKPSNNPKTSPLRIITSKELERFGYVNVGQALHYILPSFHSVPQTIADPTDHIDPATMKGLGPDQLLVQINGKRLNPTSSVNVNGTIGRGTVGTDLNAISIAAIDSIQVLEDGAATLYGSDAIAGVINIILKRNFDQRNLQATVQYGGTDAGDGTALIGRLSGGYNWEGNNKKKPGFIGGSLAYTNWSAINRSGEYTGPVYDSTNLSKDKKLILQNNFFDATGYDDKRIMEVGKAATTDVGGTINFEQQICDNWNIYAFGKFDHRKGEAAGFYRLPYQKEKVFLDSFPNGFSPRIISNILDYSGNVGITYKPTINNQQSIIDIGGGWGRNEFGFGVKNSNNVSTGEAWPNMEKAAGKLAFQQINFTADWRDVSIRDWLTLGAGFAYRNERYRIEAGKDKETWAIGDITTRLITVNGDTVRIPNKEPFAQVFPGFRDVDAVDVTRNNYGAYFNAEATFDKFIIEGTVRWEAYEKMKFKKDSPSNSTEKKGSKRGAYNAEWVGRAGVKYQFDSPTDNIKKITYRASWNRGFRAPSLHQYWYRKVNIQIPNRIANFDNFNPIVSDSFGIKPLRPETSNNFNIGFEALLGENEQMPLRISADYFWIDIKNRIILSGLFKATDNPKFESYLAKTNAQAAQFFTNAVNTVSRGINVTASKSFEINDKDELNIDASVFFAKHKVLKIDASSIKIDTTKLISKKDILFNREEVSRIEVAQPNTKFTICSVYSIDKTWDFSLRFTQFGEVQYIDPVNSLKDQVFSPKWVTDLNITTHLKFKDKEHTFISVSAGINNLFDVYPDKHTNPANIEDGRFIYSRRVQQFGVAGRFAYVQLNCNLDW